MGETTPRKEDQVRADHNRQTRRAGLCIRARRPLEQELADWMGAGGLAPGEHELAKVAARIAEELELSPDAIDELLFGQTASGSLPQA
jgi:hypothetical protein